MENYIPVECRSPFDKEQGPVRIEDTTQQVGSSIKRNEIKQLVVSDKI